LPACPQLGLPAVVRALRSRSRCSSPSSPSARPGAMVHGVRAVALAPNSRADYLLLLQVLSTGQGGRDRRRGARNPPHPRPRARAAAPPARLIDPARARRPPPASHTRLALYPRPLMCAVLEALNPSRYLVRNADDRFSVPIARSYAPGQLPQSLAPTRRC